jgi:hypothetical protein
MNPERTDVIDVSLRTTYAFVVEKRIETQGDVSCPPLMENATFKV